MSYKCWDSGALQTGILHQHELFEWHGRPEIRPAFASIATPMDIRAKSRHSGAWKPEIATVLRGDGNIVRLFVLRNARGEILPMLATISQGS